MEYNLEALTARSMKMCYLNITSLILKHRNLEIEIK